jgi:cell pole-organizing protein PopZ
LDEGYLLDPDEEDSLFDQVAKPTTESKDRGSDLDPGELLRDHLARKIRNTEAAKNPQQVAKLARLDRKDPALAETVADMLAECEVTTVEQALEESNTVAVDPQEEASDVLRQMLAKVKSAWRIACPKKASPALGAAVLESVADEWLNGGWF